MLRLCEHAADATQRFFCALCLFSPPPSVRSAGLWECGTALRCRHGTHPSCLGSADCQIVPHSSPCSAFIVDTFLSPPPSLLWKTSRILYTFRFNTSLSLPTHLAIWNFLKFFICNPGSRCLTAALYFFRTMVCVSLILTEVVNVVSDCQEFQIFSKPQDSSNTNTMEFSLFWVMCFCLWPLKI